MRKVKGKEVGDSSGRRGTAWIHCRVPNRPSEDDDNDNDGDGNGNGDGDGDDDGYDDGNDKDIDDDDNEGDVDKFNTADQDKQSGLV